MSACTGLVGSASSLTAKFGGINPSMTCSIKQTSGGNGSDTGNLSHSWRLVKNSSKFCFAASLLSCSLSCGIVVALDPYLSVNRRPSISDTVLAILVSIALVQRKEDSIRICGNGLGSAQLSFLAAQECSKGAVGAVKGAARRNAAAARVNGGVKVDRVGGRSLAAIIWRMNPVSLPQRSPLNSAVCGLDSGQLRSGPCG